MKEDAASWKDGSVKVTCSGKKIVRTDYSIGDDLEHYAERQARACDELEDLFDAGKMFVDSDGDVIIVDDYDDDDYDDDDYDDDDYNWDDEWEWE